VCVSRAKSQRWQRGGNASNNCTVISQLLQWKDESGYEIEYLGTMSNDGAAK